MVTYNISFGHGISVGPGLTAGSGTGGGGYGTAGVNGSIGAMEIGLPVIPGQQLEDSTATVNGSIGFTINNDADTGVAIHNLSASNQTFFATYGGGTKSVNWGPGSSVASGTVNIVYNSGSDIVFFIEGQTGPATYNYPFTFI